MNSPSIYQFFLAMKDEIDKHKWIESEKVGYDVGREFALIDWLIKHKTQWKLHYIQTHPPSASVQKNG